MAAKRKPERVLLRVVQGGFRPADGYSASLIDSRKYKPGENVLAAITKARIPGHHRLAHSLGAVLAENIDAFAGMDAHAVLKRLQIEANAGCDEIGLNFPGVGPCVYRVPRSLSYESMDQAEFDEVFKQLCSHVCAKYWPTMTPESVEQMALMMGNA